MEWKDIFVSLSTTILWIGVLYVSLSEISRFLLTIIKRESIEKKFDELQKSSEVNRNVLSNKILDQEHDIKHLQNDITNLTDTTNQVIRNSEKRISEIVDITDEVLCIHEQLLEKIMIIDIYINNQGHSERNDKLLKELIEIAQQDMTVLNEFKEQTKIHRRQKMEEIKQKEIRRANNRYDRELER